MASMATMGRAGRLRWHSTTFTGEVEQQLWAEFPRPGGWVVGYRLAPQEGEVVVAEVRIYPEGDLPRGGITTDLWRTVRLSEPRRKWPEAIATLAEEHGEEIATMMLERVGISPVSREQHRPGRGGHGDIYYAKIASDYVRLLNRRGSEGKRVTPTKELARRRPFKGQPNAEQAARDAIHAARERGLLTPSPPGRAGGRLTERAISLLEQEQRTKRRRK